MNRTLRMSGCEASAESGDAPASVRGITTHAMATPSATPLAPPALTADKCAASAAYLSKGAQALPAVKVALMFRSVRLSW